MGGGHYEIPSGFVLSGSLVCVFPFGEATKMMELDQGTRVLVKGRFTDLLYLEGCKLVDVRK